MKSDTRWHHRSRSARILLACLTICTATQAQSRVSVRVVPTIPDYKEAGDLVRSIPKLDLRSSQDDWERSLLDAASRSFSTISIKAAGPLVGMTIVNQDGMDTVVSQWQPGDSAADGVLGIWIWDTPEYNWFVVKCDAAKLSSTDATTRTLENFLRWQPMPGSPLNVRYAPSSHPRFLAGEMRLPYAETGLEYSVQGITESSATYLLIQVGKALFLNVYPAGGAYVPERFPPLTQLAKGWSKERILSETEKTWLSRGPSTYHSNRDSILISELTVRGFTRDDLERLLLAPNPPSSMARELRTEKVMGALIKSQQLERNREALEDVTLRMDSIRGSPLALSAIFGALWHVSSDFSALAIKCLMTCRDQEPPLQYLLRKGVSEQAFKEVEKAALPERLRPLQQRAKADIRSRIEAGTKNH